MLLLAIYNAVKGDALTQRPIRAQIADIETAFGNNKPHIAAYGLRNLVSAHGHKAEIIPAIEAIIDHLKQGAAFPASLNSEPTLLERTWDKKQHQLVRAARRNPPGAIDVIFSQALSGYFAPPPETPLQYAEQAVLDGLNKAVETYREEPQMVAITRTLLDMIIQDEPRRVREAVTAILNNLTPKFMGLRFCMDTPKDDLPDFLNRQFIATDPLRRTLQARYHL